MDKYLIKKTGKSFDYKVPPEKANKLKSQPEKDEEYERKRQQTFSDFYWLQLAPIITSSPMPLSSKNWFELHVVKFA